MQSRPTLNTPGRAKPLRPQVLGSNLFRPLALTSLLVVAIVLATSGGSYLTRYYLLPDLVQQRLQEIPDQAVAYQLAQLLEVSPRPAEKLAEMLAHPRPAVTIAAIEHLEMRVESWSQRPGIEVTDEAAQWVAALEPQLPHYSDTTRRQVAEAIAPLTAWKFGRTDALERGLLLALEEIIRSGAASATTQASPASESLLSRYMSQHQEQQRENPQPVQVAEVGSLDMTADLPVVPGSVPPVLGQSQAAAPVFSTSEGKENRLAAQAEANQPLAIAEPAKLPRLLQRPKVLAQNRVATTKPNFGQKSTLEVIWQLHAQSEQLVEAAQAELRRRHFDEEDLQLAAQIAHPDVAQRLQLVRNLPAMSRSDAATWLYYMIKDPDESVRYAAAAALLTSADPRIHRRLQVDLGSDPSPRVQRLIRR